MRVAIALIASCAVLAPASSGAKDSGYLSIALVTPAQDAAPGAAAPQWTVFLDGYIDATAATRLAAVVAQQRIRDATVYLNSPGGSLLAGMAIGRLLRQHGFATDVGARSADPLRPSGGVCYSACPFAYAGGVRRQLHEDSALGIHRAGNRVPVPDQTAFERRVEADATSYLIEMGVSPQLFTLMTQVPAGDLRLLDREEAMALQLVNAREEGPAVAGPGEVMPRPTRERP